MKEKAGRILLHLTAASCMAVTASGADRVSPPPPLQTATPVTTAPTAQTLPVWSPPAATQLTKVAYGTDFSQRLDLYVPPGLQSAPMLLFVHGGAWSLFDKSDVHALPEFALRHGLLLASTNFRLGFGADKAAEDVASAVDWLLLHGPQYGGDPKRLFLMGHSSGAHSVVLISVDPKYLAAHGRSISDIAGVIGVDGAGYNAAEQIHSLALILKPIELGMWVVAFGGNPSALSPTLLVQKDSHYPPFLLFYTDGGRRYNTDFQDKLREAGGLCEVVDALHKNHFSIDEDIGIPGDPEGERAAAFIASGKP